MLRVDFYSIGCASEALLNRGILMGNYQETHKVLTCSLMFFFLLSSSDIGVDDELEDRKK